MVKRIILGIGAVGVAIDKYSVLILFLQSKDFLKRHIYDIMNVNDIRAEVIDYLFD